MLEGSQCARLRRPAHQSHQTGHNGHGCHLSSSCRPRQDGDDLGRPLTRTCLFGYWSGLERTRAPWTRRTIPTNRRAFRAAGRDTSDRPPDVVGDEKPIEGKHYQLDARSTHRSPYNSHTLPYSSAALASAKRCVWLPSTVTAATSSHA